MATTTRIRVLRSVRLVMLTAVGLAIVAGSVGAAGYLVTNPRRPEQKPPEKEIPTVDVSLLQASDAHVTVSVMGSVEPAVEVILKPEVAGRILSMHVEFLEGGIVKEGETLLKLDSRDYELALATAEAQVDTAKANLRIEEGQQDVAQHEWDLLKMENATEEESDLALRQPFLEQEQAALRTAETQVAQARLNLERTQIKAPFNAVIQSADVNAGDIATTQTQLARLIGTDAYWVRVMVPLDELKWIQFPKSRDDLGSPATVRSQTGVENTGHVIKLLSDLEEDGLVAQVLVEVCDPRCLTEERAGISPLFLGEYAHVDIQGTTASNVFAIARDALRDGSKVWLVTRDNRLEILSPEIVWSGLDTVFVRDLPEGQYLVTSALATPVQGMTLDLNVVDPIPGADRQVAGATGGTREVASLETK